MTATSSKDLKYFSLDTSPTILDKEINTSKIPTYNQVLFSCLAHHDEQSGREKSTIRDASKKILILLLFCTKQQTFQQLLTKKSVKKLVFTKKCKHSMKIPKMLCDKEQSLQKIE